MWEGEAAVLPARAVNRQAKAAKARRDVAMTRRNLCDRGNCVIASRLGKVTGLSATQNEEHAQHEYQEGRKSHAQYRRPIPCAKVGEHHSVGPKHIVVL